MLYLLSEYLQQNALSQKIIGQSKILKDLEARYKQFSLNEFGLPLDLQNNVVAGMKDDISNIVNEVTGGNVEDFKSAATDKTKKNTRRYRWLMYLTK